MAAILCVSDGMISVVYPVLELARRLAADGHHVTFVGHPTRRNLAVRQGLDFEALPPDHSTQFLEHDADRGLLQRFRLRQVRRESALTALGTDGFAEILRRIDPELVLVDGEMHEHVIVSVGTGRRTAVLNTFCSIWRRPGVPPPHVPARPGVGWTGSRLAMGLHWTALRWRKRLRSGRLWLRHVGCDRISRLRALANRYGFDLRTEADAGQWLIPWTYRRLPAFSLHAREFDFHHEPADHVHYLGPMSLHHRGDALAADDDARLDEAFRRTQNENRALVYATFGSAFTVGSGAISQLARAAGDQPWEVVLSLGGKNLDELGTLPRNVHAFRWLPQLDVLKRADVAIVHGGINTIDECVLHGVPMLVYCGFETDMAGNMARVVHHGLGVPGDPLREGPNELRQHVDRLLTEPRFRETVANFRSHYERYENERVAERTVDELLRGPS
ncbi:MAG: glycosyltransferase [Thermoanaerobaculia bacterium]|nr:glycosyltransferase [Thermoanaerobaculia bacterium]